jgi:PqqD family protein of HPr-rel-A system
MPADRPKARTEGLTKVELDGEAVIYDSVSGELHHLNRTATLVFAMCDGSSSVKELSAEIASAFGAPAGEVERQVRALIQDLRKADLLDGRPASSHA